MNEMIGYSRWRKDLCIPMQVAVFWCTIDGFTLLPNLGCFWEGRTYTIALFSGSIVKSISPGKKWQMIKTKSDYGFAHRSDHSLIFSHIPQFQARRIKNWGKENNGQDVDLSELYDMRDDCEDLEDSREKEDVAVRGFKNSLAMGLFIPNVLKNSSD